MATSYAELIAEMQVGAAGHGRVTPCRVRALLQEALPPHGAEARE